MTADLTVTSESYTVSMSLLGAAQVPAERPKKGSVPDASERSSVTYAEVFPGQDLEYQVLPGQVKETIVLSAVPASTQVSWVWRIHAPGLTIAKLETGAFSLTDAEGVVRYSLSTPLMFDSSGIAEVSEPALTAVPTSLEQEKSGDWVLALTPDRQWLADPARVYPVFIDPTIDSSPIFAETVSYQKRGTTLLATIQDGRIRVGNSRTSSTNTLWRTVSCYQYPSVTMANNEITPGTYMHLSYSSGTKNGYTGYVSQGDCCWFG